MLALEPHGDGAILPVRAQPGARRNEIRGEQNGMLKVCVTQSPEKGKANKAIVDLLSKKLAVKKSQIELLAGETSHQKRFLVRASLSKSWQDAFNRPPIFNSTPDVLPATSLGNAPQPVGRFRGQRSPDRDVRSCYGRAACRARRLHPRRG